MRGFSPNQSSMIERWCSSCCRLRCAAIVHEGSRLLVIASAQRQTVYEPKYTRFPLMITTSALVLFGLMSLNTYSIGHISFSETRAYMLLVMGAPHWHPSIYAKCCRWMTNTAQPGHRGRKSCGVRRITLVGAQPDHGGYRIQICPIPVSAHWLTASLRRGGARSAR